MMTLDRVGNCLKHRAYACWHCRYEDYWAAQGVTRHPNKVIDERTVRPVESPSPSQEESA